LKEFENELARKQDADRIRECYQELGELIESLRSTAKLHGEYPILWFVSGEANFLRHRDDQAIEDYTKSLTEIDKVRDDPAALQAAVARYPYVHLAALGRARARLRRHCTGYLYTEHFTGVRKQDYIRRAQKQRDAVQKDLELAGRGNIPPLQAELANMWLTYARGRLQDFIAAAKHMQPLIESGGRNEEAYFMAGLLNSHTVPKGLEYYRASVSRYYAQPQVWLYIALLHYTEGKLGPAHEALDQAMLLRPDSMDTVIMRCVILQKEERYEDALGLLAGVPAEYRNHPVCLYWEANAETGLGRYEEALADYNRALRLDPSHLLPLLGRAELSLKQGRIDEALKDFERAMRHSELTSRAVERIIAVKRERGGMEEVLAYVNQHIGGRPNGVSWYALRARIYEEMGHLEKAIDDLKRVAESPRGDQSVQRQKHAALRRMIHIWKESDELDKALTYLSRGVDAEPDHLLYYRLRAGIYEQMGRVDSTIADLERIMSLQPEHPQIPELRQHISRLREGTP